MVLSKEVFEGEDFPFKSSSSPIMYKSKSFYMVTLNTIHGKLTTLIENVNTYNYLLYVIKKYFKLSSKLGLNLILRNLELKFDQEGNPFTMLYHVRNSNGENEKKVDFNFSFCNVDTTEDLNQSMVKICESKELNEIH